MELLRTDMIHVICPTNCDDTELFINDKSYGIKQLKDCPEGYLTWILPFTEGELKAVGRNEKQDKVTNVLSTVGSASNIRLVSIDECLKADGKDITHVIAEITDSKGQLVSSAQDEIHVVVEGGGSLLGLENGNLRDTTPYSNHFRTAYNGRLLIYIESARCEGTIKVTAKAEGLVGAELEIPCKIEKV